MWLGNLLDWWLVRWLAVFLNCPTLLLQLPLFVSLHTELPSTQSIASYDSQICGLQDKVLPETEPSHRTPTMNQNPAYDLLVLSTSSYHSSFAASLPIRVA